MLWHKEKAEATYRGTNGSGFVPTNSWTLKNHNRVQKL